MGWGDELMAAGLARRAMQSDPRRVRILDKNGRDRWHSLWHGNRRIVMPGETGDFQSIVNGSSARPYHLSHTADRWTYNLNFRAAVPELVLSQEEETFGRKRAGKVIIEPNIKKNAAPNKQWGWLRWNKLAWLLRREGVDACQVGETGTAVLDGVDFLQTHSFRSACAVIKHARAVVLPEGGLHHAAAAFDIPGVVIFGGFTPVELTGYSMHRNLGASMSEACGMRILCSHCSAWMATIDPVDVANLLIGALQNETNGRTAEAVVV